MSSDEAVSPRDAAATQEVLARWEEFGGVWHVSDVHDGAATVVLCRCDGGEVVEVLRSVDPAFLRWITDLEET